MEIRKFKFKIKPNQHETWISHLNELNYKIDSESSFGEYIFIDGDKGTYFFGNKYIFDTSTNNYDIYHAWQIWEGLRPFKLVIIDEI